MTASYWSVFEARWIAYAAEPAVAAALRVSATDQATAVPGQRPAAEAAPPAQVPPGTQPGNLTIG